MSRINNDYDYHYKFLEYITFLKKKAASSDISYKHAAALIDSAHIYSSGVNRFVKTFQIKSKETNEIQTHFKTVHAEINVFSKMPKKSVKGLDILVIRINKQLALKNSRPCNNCIDKLKKIGIRKVFYSNENGNIIGEFINDMEKYHISSGTKFMERISCI